MKSAPSSAPRDPSAALITIGTLRERLLAEFPDISISKIRYLEREGLLAPSRTRAGYRLYSDADVERLATVLRLQRDEYLPLRIIREELSAPGNVERQKRELSPEKSAVELDLAELCRQAQLTPELAHELEANGLIKPRLEEGERRYSDSDADIAFACAKIAARGLDPRHLRVFCHASERVSRLLEQISAPALRSPSPERRRAGLAELEELLAHSRDLVDLLVWRDLNELVSH